MSRAPLISYTFPVGLLGCGCARCGPPAPLPSSQVVDPNDLGALARFVEWAAERRAGSAASFAETGENRPTFWGIGGEGGTATVSE